jgi:transcriptional regulator GlxA family with amidase domain
MQPVVRGRRSRPASTPPLLVVERIEAYARAHTSTRVPISRLCLIAGLSERGLRNAFYRTRGMSPTRCILAERLQGAHRALTDAANRPTTVTAVATRFGFHELGRFAAAYKESFGEAPSETLRGTVRKAQETR